MSGNGQRGCTPLPSLTHTRSRASRYTTHSLSTCLCASQIPSRLGCTSRLGMPIVLPLPLTQDQVFRVPEGSGVLFRRRRGRPGYAQGTETRHQEAISGPAKTSHPARGPRMALAPCTVHAHTHTRTHTYTVNDLHNIYFTKWEISSRPAARRRPPSMTRTAHSRCASAAACPQSSCSFPPLPVPWPCGGGLCRRDLASGCTRP